MIMLSIFKTYILPIIDYCSPIWNQNRIGLNNIIEKSFHDVTRTALGAPFDVRSPNYIPHIKRLEILGLPDLSLRLKSQATNLGLRILKGETDSYHRNLMESYLYQGRRNLRNFRLFQYRRSDVPVKSPIEVIMSSMTYFQNQVTLLESTATTKSKIKKKKYWRNHKTCRRAFITISTLSELCGILALPLYKVHLTGG